MKNVYVLILFLFSGSQCVLSQVQKGSLLLGGGLNLSVSSVEEGHLSLPPSVFLSGTDVSGYGFNLRTEGGWIVSDNMAVGLNLSYAYGRAEATTLNNNFPPVIFDTIVVIGPEFPFPNITSNTTTVSGQRFSLGPFLRYYRPFKNPKFGFQMDMGATIGFGKTATRFEPSLGPDSTQPELKNSNFTIGVSPGLYYFITPCLAVNVSIGGMAYHFEEREEVTSISVNSNIQEIEKIRRTDFDLFLSDNLYNRIGLSFFLNGNNKE